MRLLVTECEDFSVTALERLNEIYDVETLDITNRQLLIEKIKTATVLFVRLRFNIDKELLDSAINLKYILTATTGLDHIDVAYFESKGGIVISLKDEKEFLDSIPSTAEHTWGLLLSLMRKIPSSFNDVKNGNWRRDLFKGNNLKNKKIGILGLGRVGQQVAQYASVFGMEVGFYDIKNIVNANYRFFDTAAQLFTWADIVTIHIPLNDENVHFVNKELLDACNENTVIINTSRGAVVDENHIAEIIKHSKIKGYATDVIENEMQGVDEENKLIALAKSNFNIIITPHIAGATFESMAATEEFIVMKLINSFKK